MGRDGHRVRRVSSEGRENSLLKLLSLTMFLYTNGKGFEVEDESKFLKVKSRIDFFLVSNSLCESVLEVDTKASIVPDHKAVNFYNLITTTAALVCGSLIILYLMMRDL